ncbi:MAG TPA: hypothetical protein PKY30_01315, partial [Myxococcota bacterium]|nr:hypothetical protein [Myxococcota bacterium]
MNDRSVGSRSCGGRRWRWRENGCICGGAESVATGEGDFALRDHPMESLIVYITCILTIIVFPFFNIINICTKIAIRRDRAGCIAQPLRLADQIANLRACTGLAKHS